MLQQELFLIRQLKLSDLMSSEKNPYQTTKKDKKQCKVYIKYYAVLQSASQYNKLPFHITKCDKVLLPSTKYQPVLQRTILTLTTVSMSHAVLQSIIEYTVYNQLLIRTTVATHETSSIHMHWTGQQRPACITTK